MAQTAGAILRDCFFNWKGKPRAPTQAEITWANDFKRRQEALALQKNLFQEKMRKPAHEYINGQLVHAALNVPIQELVGRQCSFWAKLDTPSGRVAACMATIKGVTSDDVEGQVSLVLSSGPLEKECSINILRGNVRIWTRGESWIITGFQVL